MRRLCFVLVSLLASIFADAQYVYKGVVDKYPVEFLMDSYSDAGVSAVYAYERFDKPIRISGRQTDSGLTLIERSFELVDTTTMIFRGGRPGDDSLKGVWFNVRTGKRFEIRLAKDIQLDAGDGAAYTDYGIIQDAELDSAYFRLLVSRNAGEGPGVTGLRVYRKGDDKLLQELRFEAVFLGLGGVMTGDYNFDGYEEFSVFEEGFSGPNTSSAYFLYDPKTKRFFRSEIRGISLEFDQVRKRIIEVNQCCAGSQVQRIEYRLAGNKMVKTATHCFIWNHQKERLEERPAKACE